MTDPEFNECMAALFTYYRLKVDPDLSVIYGRRFINYDYNLFFTAVNKHIDDERYNFFPKTHELKEFLPKIELEPLRIESTASCLCENSHKLIAKYRHLYVERKTDSGVNK